MISRVSAYWNKVVAFLGKIKGFPIILSRLALGITFFQTGWGKLHNLDQVTEFFRSLGIPYPQIQAPFVAGVEFFCGSLLLVGLASRLACIPLIGTMVVAILTAKLNDMVSWTDIFGFIEFLYIVLLLFVMTAGPGVFSLDHLLTKKFKLRV